MPSGASAKPGWLGSAAWQEMQRACMISAISSSPTRAAPVSTAAGRRYQTIASSNTTAIAGSASGARPEWRMTKYCRISTPASMMKISTSQPRGWL